MIDIQDAPYDMKRGGVIVTFPLSTSPSPLQSIKFKYNK